ncbi:hypothetical protein Patl1_36341 [Pistacia atlantica]|nr:hypothetical protein Patl1_36341 [Pistacia atlantica]
MKLALKNGWNSVLPLRLRGSSATRFCMFPKVKSAGFSPGNTPVYLNVYDLTPINGYVYWAGVGIFHTGVEDHPSLDASHYHWNMPLEHMTTKQVVSLMLNHDSALASGLESQYSLGTTCLDPVELREFMERQSANYNGDTYHLIAKNCNHFCEDICYKLTGNPIPKWVNRLARIGSLCNCILPEGLKSTTVQHDPNFQGCESEKKRLRTAFSCWSSISMPHKEVSISSLFLHSHYKGCLPPWELKRSESGSMKKLSKNASLKKL